jgi:MSHA pilin protein MshD
MSHRTARGVTLVELIVFIVIVGVALAGLFAAFDTITRASADPQVRKQALAIAESLMAEVQLMPFTFCDPDDANAATATSATVGAGPTNCATVSEDTAIGPESVPSAETRYSLTSRFDNVSDYHDFKMGALYSLPAGIQDIAGGNISGLEAYSAKITITQAGLDVIAAADALLISITVNGPGSVAVTLEGYRTRYAPTTLP